jgi:hypothetical protein
VTEFVSSDAKSGDDTPKHVLPFPFQDRIMVVEKSRPPNSGFATQGEDDSLIGAAAETRTSGRR